MNARITGFYALQNLSCPFDLMRFYLVYRGPLSATQGKPSKRADERRRIREQVRPQLQRLWADSPALVRLKWNARVPDGTQSYMGGVDSPLYAHYQTPPKYPVQDDFVDLSGPVDRHGFQYMPLVRRSLDLTCTMNILFLRQEEPGSLFKKAGDIDNRIKTFFDALQVPTIEGGPDGDETEDLNYCLYENDTLIRGFEIDSERLLLPESQFPNEVHLVAEVLVHVESVGPWNVALLG